MLSQIARPYRIFRFKKFRLLYEQGCATTATANLAMGYLPSFPHADSALLLDESLGGVFGALYRALLSAATVAAGPVYGPLVADVGAMVEKAAPVLAEAALKWYQNRKPSTSITQQATQMQNLDNYLVEGVDPFVTALHTYLAANSSILIHGTLPTAPTLGGFDQDQLEEAVDRNNKASFGTELEQTVQGAVYAALNGPYQGAVNESGTAPLGDFYIEYEIELGDPVFESAPDPGFNVSGDGLDNADSDPWHLSYDAPDRMSYVISELTATLPDTVSKPRLALEGPRAYEELVRSLGPESRSAIQVISATRDRRTSTHHTELVVRGMSFTGSGPNRGAALDDAARKCLRLKGLRHQPLRVEIVEDDETEAARAAVKGWYQSELTPVEVRTGRRYPADAVIVRPEDYSSGEDSLAASEAALAVLNRELFNARVAYQSSDPVVYEPVPPTGYTAKALLKRASRTWAFDMNDSLRCAVAAYARVLGVPDMIANMLGRKVKVC
jgi:hypothetical protein